jgi:ribulose 1,5-bisphosphate synthetase/thiazole synthase
MELVVSVIPAIILVSLTCTRHSMAGGSGSGSGGASFSQAAIRKRRDIGNILEKMGISYTKMENFMVHGTSSM